MSTAAFVAIHTDAGFTGNSVHYDGYPSHLGKTLHELYHETFEGDLTAMCQVLIHEDLHHGGWEALNVGTTDGSEGRNTDFVEGVGTYYDENESYGYFADVSCFPPWSRYSYVLDDDGITVHGGDGSTVFVSWENFLTRKEWETVMYLADCEGGIEFTTGAQTWTVEP